MKKNYAVIIFMYTCLCLFGCTRFICENSHKMNSQGPINIVIHTSPGNPKVLITIDGVQVDSDEIKSLIEDKKNRNKKLKTENKHKIHVYGTW